MTDDVYNTISKTYSNPFCGDLHIEMSFTPKMTKIKHIFMEMRPPTVSDNPIFNVEEALHSMRCYGWMDFITYLLSESEQVKAVTALLNEYRDKFMMAGKHHNCGQKWFREEKTYGHCLDCLIDFVNSAKPEKKE